MQFVPVGLFMPVAATDVNFHRAMMATAPGQKLYFNRVPCEELDPTTIFSLFHCEIVSNYSCH